MRTNKMNGLNDWNINNENKEKILQEIGISNECMTKGLEILRQWISLQHHFPPADIGDKFLESFLIGCKGSLEKTKCKLDAYFTCRSKYPDIFANRDPTDQEFIRYANVQPLVTLCGRTEECNRVHVSWLEGNEYDVTKWIKRIVAHWEIILRKDPWSAGEIFLISGTNFTFSQAAKLTPNDVATLFSLAKNVYPMRIKRIWFFNAPPACDFIVNKILKPIISKKLSERIQVHSGDHKVLLDNFSIKLLPQDYGGEADNLGDLKDLWLEKLLEYRYWFIGQGTMTTDESKRPSSTVDSFGSVAGTFRKLQID